MRIRASLAAVLALTGFLVVTAAEGVGDARRAGAEVFVTGEMRFHDYLAARADGVGLLLPGHYASERCGVEALAGRLGGRWPSLVVWASRREADPARRA